MYSHILKLCSNIYIALDKSLKVKSFGYLLLFLRASKLSVSPAILPSLVIFHSNIFYSIKNIFLQSPLSTAAGQGEDGELTAVAGFT